jgi:hypothetical protein
MMSLSVFWSEFQRYASSNQGTSLYYFFNAIIKLTFKNWSQRYDHFFWLFSQILGQKKQAF